MPGIALHAHPELPGGREHGKQKEGGTEGTTKAMNLVCTSAKLPLLSNKDVLSMRSMYLL